MRSYVAVQVRTHNKGTGRRAILSSPPPRVFIYGVEFRNLFSGHLEPIGFFGGSAR
jgi:hypothetical protein